MLINGLTKTTLLDYPGHVAATIFAGGCNFRCPFCHNGDLVLHPASLNVYSETEVLEFLTLRKGKLSGVCISGGEPTLQADLFDFIKNIKDLGYLVKLDTNGSNPDILAKLRDYHLIDYIAMDIKNSKTKYAMTAGLSSLDLSKIEASVSFIQNCNLDYEFRTTVVRELHQAEDFHAIGEWLAGGRAYFLQSYQDNENVISTGFHAFPKETLLDFLTIIRTFVPNTNLRGID